MLKLILILAFAVSVNGFCNYEDPSEDLPDGIDSRIWKPEFVWRNQFPGHTGVAYILANDVDFATEIAIKDVLRDIRREVPCLVFYHEDAASVSRVQYLNITLESPSNNCGSGASGGVSDEGRSLEMGSNICPKSAKPDDQKSRDVWKQVFLHEMFHVFGIMHTQKHKNRDKYITVHMDNVWENATSQYEICSNCTYPPTDFNFQYECDSIMHYSSKTFSQGKKTMTTKNETVCPQNVLDSRNMKATAQDWKLLRWAANEKCCEEEDCGLEKKNTGLGSTLNVQT